MTYRKHTLEARLDALLPVTDKPLRVQMFELWREAEGGWSVNDSWSVIRDREDAISLLRDRWEVFKLNYLPKVRVRDLCDIGDDEETMLEVDCTAFANVSVETEEGSAK